MVEPGVRDLGVAEAWSGFAIADLHDVNPPSDGGPTTPRRAGQPAPASRALRKSHRNRRFAIIRIVGRLWIPLLIVVVLGAGGLTVSRLHGVFGTEKSSPYANSQSTDSTRFDPKRLTYEVFGPPGTVATISYFDVNANPQRVLGARLPWSVTFATSEATAVESVVAQGDTNSIGCRILVDGVVKTEQTKNEVSPFISCRLKDE